MSYKIVLISHNNELFHFMDNNSNIRFEVICQTFSYIKENLCETICLYIIQDKIFTYRSLCMINKIRSLDNLTPILFISEQKNKKIRIYEKIRAIESGVDEYLSYPQTMEEITASIRALIRRTERITDGNVISVKEEFVINSGSRKIILKGQEIPFTKLEFNIIYYLASNKDRAVTYKELYEAVWQKEYLCDDMNIMAHIHRIRQKLEADPKHPKYIQNIYGIGYRFAS